MPLAPSRLVALALFSISVCGIVLPAHAASDGQRKPPTKVTFHKAPSEESPQAREKRMVRECKGRPNAGMCAGFTR